MKLTGLAKKRHYILVMAFILSFVLVHIVQAVRAAETSQDITVASQDYVDAKIGELNAKIVQLTQQLQDQSKYNTFTVIKITKGQTLIAGASAEIIVRSGTASAISGSQGDSLADMTTDNSEKTNLANGQTVPINHLILISRDDGRGVKAVSGEVYLLVKGTFTIK